MENGERYWNTYDEFLDEDDTTLIFNLAIAYYNNNLFDIKIIREIARSPAWRFRWNVARKGADLFGKPVSEWSEMQNMLVYWSQVYDMAFESAERPPDSVINDDMAFDTWLNQQSAEFDHGSKKINPQGKIIKGNKNHNEFFIMSDGSKDSVKEIQEKNPESVRRKLRREQKIIKEKGRVSEWELREKGRPRK